MRPNVSFGQSVKVGIGPLTLGMKLHHRGTPTPGGFVSEAKSGHEWKASQASVNCLSQGSHALPVNDADVQKTVGPALGEVCLDQIAHLGGPKTVEVEGAVDGNFDGVRLVCLGIFPLASHVADDLMTYTPWQAGHA